MNEIQLQANFSDFIFLNTTISWAAKENEKNLSIVIVNDELYELAESFQVIHTTLSNNAIAIATITIDGPNDISPGVINLTPALISVTEESSNVRVCIIKHTCMKDETDCNISTTICLCS